MNSFQNGVMKIFFILSGYYVIPSYDFTAKRSISPLSSQRILSKNTKKVFALFETL